ncbi:MAG: (Fe-S)-binding protein [Nanoarchaeota archaeon]|nr:(Fe-S)-binding protein [Nanoarchaeota archaeon]MBU1321137.1 (Fe-S)-binding protein [Nanoarchaeota archaeon]MBU1597968.1 (Fe-S)-binding protein [Nanoarchaeota archaeon]MBU2441813.1 (Fe-S)-binding protein [Nanoarchaeota archaeon]
MPSTFFHKIKTAVSGLKPENILYYPGCMTQYALKEVFEDYKAILVDLGIDFVTINDLVCCGSPLLNAGYEKDFNEIKEKNLGILKQNKITKIITNCPHCYDIFKHKYGLNVEHTLQTLAANKRKISVENTEEVAYHDPCILARKNNIFQEPREVLKHTGFHLEEPLKSKDCTFCCGAGGGVKQNSSKIADKIAKERLSQLKSNKIIVSCPYCYAHLKENATKKKIIEISKTLVEE